jgi:hypothetical protein
LEDYQLGDEKPYLNLVDWPLEVKR